MQGGHGSRCDAACKAVAHYQIIPFSELVQKTRYVAEIVGPITVAHEDIFSRSNSNAPHEGAAVSLALDMDDANTHAFGDSDRTVAAAVICDHNFSADIVISNSVLNLLDARTQGGGLVQAGQHHAEFYISRLG